MQFVICDHILRNEMGLEKITTKTLRERVYNQLRQKIISAEILPGESIKLRDLATRFDVSMMPVREALWQLESERVIVIESNKSIHVSSLSAKEMEEALRIRLFLESMAAEGSCDQRPESAIPKLKRLLKSLKGSIDKPKKYMKINSEFHFTLYSYADSPILLEIINGLWARIGPYLIIYAMKEGDLASTVPYHYEMLDALSERNKEKMRDAIRKDLEGAAKLIIPYLAMPSQPG
jgi:DNA-binding GntR family transcriptional regulator